MSATIVFSPVAMRAANTRMLTALPATAAATRKGWD
jgi:hypothetical protein